MCSLDMGHADWTSVILYLIIYAVQKWSGREGSIASLKTLLS